MAKEVIETNDELQTTFNEDGMDILCEDATIENENKEEVEEDEHTN